MGYVICDNENSPSSAWSSSNASELRAKEFSLEQAMLVKRKSADPLSANEQESFFMPKLEAIGLTYRL